MTAWDCISRVLALVLLLATTCIGGITIGPALYTTDPQHDVVIHWRTANPDAGIIYYGADWTLSLGILTESVIDTSHFFTIDGLLPGTQYFYKILSDFDADSGQFWTAPAETQTTESWEIAIYGDSQGSNSMTRPSPHNQVRFFRGVVNKMIEYYPRFAIHLGDMVWGYPYEDESYLQEDYDVEFFEPAAALNRNTIHVVVPGNHDIGPLADSIHCTLYPGPNARSLCWSTWRKNVVNPGNGSFFSFDYGPIRFVVLNADIYPCWCEDEPGEFEHGGVNQLRTGVIAWLSAELDAALEANPRYIIVLTHFPPFGCGYLQPGHIPWPGGYYQDPNLFQPLVSLARTHQVSAWFSGHHHYYMHIDRADDDITYLISGRSAAGGVYPTYDSSYVVYTDTTHAYPGNYPLGRHHFLRILVNNDSLLVIATDTLGISIDSVRIYPRIPPTNLSPVISIAGDDCLLIWNDLPGATLYHVYRSADPLFNIEQGNLIGSTTEPSFTDSGAVIFSGPQSFYKITCIRE